MAKDPENYKKHVERVQQDHQALEKECSIDKIEAAINSEELKWAIDEKRGIDLEYYKKLKTKLETIRDYHQGKPIGIGRALPAWQSIKRLLSNELSLEVIDLREKLGLLPKPTSSGTYVGPWPEDPHRHYDLSSAASVVDVSLRVNTQRDITRLSGEPQKVKDLNNSQLYGLLFQRCSEVQNLVASLEEKYGKLTDNQKLNKEEHLFFRQQAETLRSKTSYGHALIREIRGRYNNGIFDQESKNGAENTIDSLREYYQHFRSLAQRIWPGDLDLVIRDLPPREFSWKQLNETLSQGLRYSPLVM